MRVCDCEHPKMIYNKYTKQKVMVPCGLCDTCKRKRQQLWVAKIVQESKCWQFTYSLNLDYNDASIPMLDFSDDGDFLVQTQQRLLTEDNYDYTHIRIDELKFNGFKDYDYFVNRINQHHTAISVGSVRDIQLFKKRLNTKICREITGKYSNFRSVIVLEYGPTTFRPHYHGVLFFNDSRIASQIDRLVRDCWRSDSGDPFGHAFAEADKGHFGAYLAKYISRPTDIPSFYDHPKIRPFVLSSRKPPIGSLQPSTSEVREIFNNGLVQRVIFEKNDRDGWMPRFVPLAKGFKDRLFPKCPLYCSLTDPERIELYRCAIDQRGIISDFDDFINHLRFRVFDVGLDLCGANYNGLSDRSVGSVNFNIEFGSFSVRNSQFARNIMRLSDNFSSEHALRSLHNACCRVYFQSEVFGVSIDYYISRILLYYRNFELYKLRQFYQMQVETLERYPNIDIRSFYPLTYFALANPAEQDCSQDYFRTQKFLQDEETKTHKLNAYKDSRYCDPVLYNLSLNYYG